MPPDQQSFSLFKQYTDLKIIQSRSKYLLFSISKLSLFSNKLLYFQYFDIAKKVDFFFIFVFYIKTIKHILFLDNKMGNSQPQPSHESNHKASSSPPPRPPPRPHPQSRPQAQDQDQSQGIMLPIPPRIQWENDNGYCGQMSIQSISLHYGSYISEIQVRKAAGSEVLIGENAETTLEKLSYEYETWDNESHQPQYKDYLQWIKTNIKKGYPVIVGGYDPEGNKQEVYNHIYLALGVKSNDFDHYSDDDLLIYADLFQPNFTFTTFGKVWDSRQMQNNGKNLKFAIPRDIDYGVAVKGIKNHANKFLPLSITLDWPSEPNVSIGEQPIQLTLHITTKNLTTGQVYAILRYDHYQNIPSSKIKASQASNIVKFEAEDTSYSFDDTVLSSEMVFYRCVSEKDLQ